MKCCSLFPWNVIIESTLILFQEPPHDLWSVLRDMLGRFHVIHSGFRYWPAYVPPSVSKSSFFLFILVLKNFIVCRVLKRSENVLNLKTGFVSLTKSKILVQTLNKVINFVEGLYFVIQAKN